MSRTPNIGPAGLYAKLVALYPASYRQKYGQPMVQAFDDMLEDEPTRFGKLAIWLRALGDLPPSLTKEHITNGKGVQMSKNFKIFLAAVGLVLVIANGASYWFGYLHARTTVGIERVTTTQLADAMQHDGFYSTYGDAALLFTGKITHLQQQNGTTVVTFETNRAYQLECQFSHASVRLSQTVSVAASGGTATRLPHGVLLHNCLQN